MKKGILNLRLIVTNSKVDLERSLVPVGSGKLVGLTLAKAGWFLTLGSHVE